MKKPKGKRMQAKAKGTRILGEWWGPGSERHRVTRSWAVHGARSLRPQFLAQRRRQTCGGGDPGAPPSRTRRSLTLPGTPVPARSGDGDGGV